MNLKNFISGLQRFKITQEIENKFLKVRLIFTENFQCGKKYWEFWPKMLKLVLSINQCCQHLRRTFWALSIRIKIPKDIFFKSLRGSGFGNRV